LTLERRAVKVPGHPEKGEKQMKDRNQEVILEKGKGQTSVIFSEYLGEDLGSPAMPAPI